MPCTPLNMLKIYNRFCAGRQGYIVRQADTYEELLERWSVDNAYRLHGEKKQT